MVYLTRPDPPSIKDWNEDTIRTSVRLSLRLPTVWPPDHNYSDGGSVNKQVDSVRNSGFGRKHHQANYRIVIIVIIIVIKHQPAANYSRNDTKGPAVDPVP